MPCHLHIITNVNNFPLLSGTISAALFYEKMSPEKCDGGKWGWWVVWCKKENFSLHSAVVKTGFSWNSSFFFVSGARTDEKLFICKDGMWFKLSMECNVLKLLSSIDGRIEHDNRQIGTFVSIAHTTCGGHHNNNRDLHQAVSCACKQLYQDLFSSDHFRRLVIDPFYVDYHCSIDWRSVN